MPKEQEVREVMKRLRKEEWEEESGKGSHVVFRKDGRTVSVPTSKKELRMGTYRNIAKTAGWL
ncbi:type II toxin-antitoxin system HicA family toxin [Gordonibacter urolithinfaciens]|uniref:type II toxin-antitoxin system HicA family toxin n=1 Tax=Gordonibacter urolithinfaciens TaxID=1335613 RepID=UPI001D072494|nr:type II toxin-antitoxin system HicA family toxin [Gordonibacter urolithinfaciens]MCB7085754.1 type II toxin-antitoxin system HicA family toxin [Gordonibacter urolithinfaciens]